MPGRVGERHAWCRFARRERGGCWCAARGAELGRTIEQGFADRTGARGFGPAFLTKFRTGRVVVLAGRAFHRAILSTLAPIVLPFGGPSAAAAALRFLARARPLSAKRALQQAQRNTLGAAKIIAARVLNYEDLVSPVTLKMPPAVTHGVGP